MLLLPALLMAQMQINTVVTHQPLEVLKSVAGAGLKNVGLYELITCNRASTPVTISEGRILQSMGQQVGSISQTTIRSVLARSKRKTKTYRALRVLEYLGTGAALYATRGKAGPGTARVAFSGLIASGFANKMADVVKEQDDSASRTMDALADASRTVTLEAKGCYTRLAFGVYRAKSMDSFEIQWNP